MKKTKSKAKTAPQQETGGDCNPRLVRWRASGICMVPNEVEIFVWAASEVGAKRVAKAKFKSRPREHILGNSQDESSAWDFRPEVEICPPNAESIRAEIKS